MPDNVPVNTQYNEPDYVLNQPDKSTDSQIQNAHAIDSAAHISQTHSKSLSTDHLSHPTANFDISQLSSAYTDKLSQSVKKNAEPLSNDIPTSNPFNILHDNVDEQEPIFSIIACDNS